MLDKGDLDGKRVWVRIMRAIEELQRNEKEPGETHELNLRIEPPGRRGLLR